MSPAAAPPAAKRWSPALRRVLWLALALMLASWPWLVDRLVAPAAEWQLRAAHFAATVDDPQARAVTLPHRWQPDCRDCRTVWYRFDLGAPVRNDALALWLTDVGRNAAAYLNGRLLGSGGRFDDPAARLGAQALLLPLPPQAWNDSDNHLYVLVKAERARFGHLGAPALAPEARLAVRERWRSAVVQTLPQVLATAAAMLGLVMALLWAYRRHEADYGALAAALLAWAVHHFSVSVVEPPLADRAWDAWLGASLALLASALGWLGWRMLRAQGAGAAGAQGAGAAGAHSAGAAGPHGHAAAHGRGRRTQAGLVAATLLALLLAAAAPLEPSGLAIDALHSSLLLAMAVAGVTVAAAGWAPPDGRLLAPGALLAMTAFAAALWPGLATTPPTQTPALALPWAMAVLGGALGWLLLLRFVHTLDAAELLAEDLEALVRERTEELQAQFERVRELERREAIAAERERLMRDMHDGVGGHLVSMLAMIEAGAGAPEQRPAELATAVRDALDDMRLMIDSLEPVDGDLNAVLAMFHDRLAPRLRAAGVTLHWEVELLPQVSGLTPARVLHVLRILQEAVTNAVRHGRSKTLRLTAAHAGQANAVRLVLRDDGCGFDTQAPGEGRGLKNMRRRAELAGGAINVTSTPAQGVTVELTLAVAGAADNAG